LKDIEGHRHRTDRNLSVRDAVRLDVELVEDPLPLVDGDRRRRVRREGVRPRDGAREHAAAERVTADRLLPVELGPALTPVCGRALNIDRKAVLFISMMLQYFIIS